MAGNEVTVHGRVGAVHPSVALEHHDAALMDLATAYWLVDESRRWVFTAAQVAAVAGWRPHEVAARVRAAATARDVTTSCPSCGEGPALSSRSDLSKTRYGGNYPCQACQQRAADDAAARRREAEEEVRRRREQLAAYAAEKYALHDTDPPVLEETRLRSAVALLALLRRGDNDLVRTLPLEHWTDPFAPASLDAEALVRDLWLDKLLQVHPGSAPDAFGYTHDGEVGIYVMRASFTVTGEGPTGRRNAAALQHLRGLVRGVWPQSWTEDAAAFAGELLLAEALNYLDLQMREHGFDLKAGDRTRLAVGRALEQFSLGQVYNIIYRAARDSAAYYQRSSVPKQQAANSVVSRIDGSIDRTLAEGWDLKAYRRDFRLPWPVLCETLFVTALAISDTMSASPEAIATAIARKGDGGSGAG